MKQTKHKYKTMKGNIIELTDKEFMEYPYNSKLLRIPEVKTKVIKKKKNIKLNIKEDE